MIAINFLLGGKKGPSVAGIKRCSPGYWAIYVGFLALCALATIYAVSMAKKEQALKLQFDVNIVKSDIILTNKAIITIICYGFFGGLITGASGLGGGVLFSTVFLSLGTPPVVAKASSLYLVTFSQIASAVVLIAFKQFDVEYGLWLSLWAVVGTSAATYLAIWYQNVSGRQSFIVWILIGCIVIGTVISTLFGTMNLQDNRSNGISITSFAPICAEK